MTNKENQYWSFVYRKTMIPLAIIVASSITLSIVAYYYSASVADTIGDIASNDIRSNAASQSHDLSLILTSGIDSISTNLQILSNSPAIQSYNQESTILFDVSQNSTNQLTDFYMWLNRDGKVEWVTNTAVGGDNYVGVDRSYREYFTVPHSTGKPYFSDIILTSDGVPRVYIAYPIIDNRPAANGLPQENRFRGIAVAAIGLDNIGNLLQQSSPLELQRNDVLLADNGGTIIYSRDSWMVGKNIFQDKNEAVRSGLVDAVELESLIKALDQTAVGSPFTTDFTAQDGRISTLTSEAVILDGERIWTVYVVAPHTLTTDVRVLFDQQNIFSTIIVMIFGALAFGIAFFILGSNRRLESLVSVRTSELSRANKSLEESNEKLAALNNQLLAANKNLQAHDVLQKEFINIASHEMKTPTQAILLHSDIVKRKPQNAAQSIDAIIRNAERLQRLTNNILDVTRIESQTLKISKEDVNLKDLIVSIIADYKSQVKSGVELNYELDDIIVQADRTRLIQVISNLMGNALEFTKHGSVLVTAEKETTGDHVIVRIFDSGPGIDPGIMPRLFTKFATKSDKGTGLGLFIAKNIIEAHGGKIWAENRKDKSGAMFGFSLPAKH